MMSQIVEKLENIVGRDWIITDIDQKLGYLYDEVEKTLRPKADENSIVVKPANTEEVSEIISTANDNGINVVVRGGGTGLCGGAIPVKESIVISMERFNKVVEVDLNNMTVTLEAGVTLFDLIEELDKYDGIGFPVHPGDEGAQIGGMAVTNAGGARAVRHGIMRNHIKGLEVVLPNGNILNLGGKLLKDNAGYNLMHLIIGSEGTLAVITKVILKIYPEDKHVATIAAAFETIDNASNAVLEILRSGVSPLAVEYQDKHINLETAEHLGLNWPLETGNADLMIIISEKEEDMLYSSTRKINDICRKNGCTEAVFAGKKQEQADLLAIRSGGYEVIKDIIADSFDMCVPPASMPAFFEDLGRIMKEYNTTTNITAHIADGNVHNDTVLVDGKIPEYAEEIKLKMYEACFKYGGTITGEHGIGKIRVEDLKLQKKEEELEIMKGIKAVFDPNSILNDGTVV
ncbi:glycolate oxidase [Dethiosulfatibacter aminovorans DSM 17477]|uniref:Glycolate oxidase n=1 Tax=Dethiosulfatibacter aminovorans DSM 17477 TaxID=1121476 RepID=A0A1M6KNY9_9FIRM|nr:FAD-binding oxidoreductase [Dethiosulfatibacter aminovorans]SHJ60659.1 glycolate oxidase [Dethiosulfatibacter aminovorans DSM 17477]